MMKRKEGCLGKKKKIKKLRNRQITGSKKEQWSKLKTKRQSTLWLSIW
jgi:hypothetical protein